MNTSPVFDSTDVLSPTIVSSSCCEFDGPSDIFREVPQRLKDLNNWVTWKIELREQKGVKKPTKPPYNPVTGKYASSNDPSTWTSFETAVSLMDQYAGIGFMLGGTALAGIDFDGCVKDGNVEPYVLEILKWLGNPYCELSPSGTGLHVFIECDPLPAGSKIKFSDLSREKYGAEFYHGSSTNRYLTVTGKRFAGDGIPKVEKIRFPYILISQILDEKFKARWMGDLSMHGNDHSAADLALMGALARLLESNPEAMRVVFGRSKLGQREKWQNRKDYQDRTIAKALEQPEQPETQTKIKPTSNLSSQSEQSSWETVLIKECFTDVEAKSIVWIWKDRIPKGKLTIFSGNPDVGKSTVLCDFIGRYTTGRAFPDSENSIEPSDVLMLIAEDDPADTIKPRLMAADADLSRVSYLKAVQVSKQSTKKERMLALDTDLALLEKTLKENPKIGLVTLDPLTGYLGKADLNKEQALRQVLHPIKELCERSGVTFIGLGHFNKRSDVSALHKVGGAVAMSGVARAVWLFSKNPEADGEYLMLLGKGNLTKKRTGLKYRISDRTLENGIEAPIIAWGDSTEGDADTVLRIASDPQEKREAKAERFLSDYLANGPRKSEEIIAAGKTAGISRCSLFAAKKELGIRAEQKERQWWWTLPHEEEEVSSPETEAF